MNNPLEFHHVVYITLDQTFALLCFMILLVKMTFDGLVEMIFIELTWSIVKILTPLFALPGDILKQKLRLSDKLIANKPIINLLPILTNKQHQPLKAIRQILIIPKLIRHLDPINKINQLTLRRFYFMFGLHMHINQKIQKLDNTFVDHRKCQLTVLVECQKLEIHVECFLYVLHYLLQVSVVILVVFDAD